jgi:recombination protein RecT
MATNNLTTTEDRRAPTPVAILSSDLRKGAQQIQNALPSHISIEKFQRTVITAAQQNPDLLAADRQSLLLACIRAAQDGLLPDGREAALVIFNQRVKEGGSWKSKKLVQYMPMVYGLRKKILQAHDADNKPLVVALETGVVYKAEVTEGYFRYEVGTEPPLNHTPMLDIAEEEATDDQIVAAYSIATMADGTKSYEIMRRFELDKVRQVSQTGATGRIAKYDMGDIKKGQKIPPKGPWVDWFAEMAKKTVMRRHSKTLPMSGDVILDIFGRDDETAAANSTANALSTPGGEPQLLTDDTDGSTYDGATGEVIEGTAEHQEDGDGGGGPQAEKPAARKARDKAKADAEPEKTQEPAASNEQNHDETDELGVTKDPSEKKAEEILAEMAAASTIIDLDKVYSREEQHISALPDEHRTVVDAAYSRHSRRLAPQRAEPETAK